VLTAPHTSLSAVPIDPWLPRAAALHPDRTAIEAPEGSLTYAELLERAEPAVPIAHPPGLDFAIALHGCLLAGEPIIPVDPRLSERERAGPAARGDGALIVHTSGTTGVPRPVALSLENILANALGSAVSLGLDPDERWLCPLPLSHVGGLMVLLRSAIYATTAIIGPAARAADDDVTVASLVPTQLQRLLDAGVRPGARLRRILLGGAPATRALLTRARDAGWPVSQTYGLTQACSQVTVAEPGDLDTAGHPLPGVGVMIAPDGEIIVEGPTVADGGVLRTGDLGRIKSDGRLVVTGRKSDTIVTGGENVAPAEVEAVLLEHPAVADAGVYGRPDPEWGQAVTARVVLRSPAEPDELRRWCRERLAGFKVPKAIEPAEALPRTESGKLLRREL
jgi:o-succinylbenzoate---CoA ligase